MTPVEPQPDGEIIAAGGSEDYLRHLVRAGLTPGAVSALLEGGGSGTSLARRFTLAFDTPNIATGATLFTPAVGDYLVCQAIVTTRWDGAVPESIADAKLNVGTALANDHMILKATGGSISQGIPIEGDIPANVLAGDLIVPDTTSTYRVPNVLAGQSGGWGWSAIVVNSVPLKAFVTDSDGNPVGTVEVVTPTQGELELVIFVIPAA